MTPHLFTGRVFVDLITFLLRDVQEHPFKPLRLFDIPNTHGENTLLHKTKSIKNSNFFNIQEIFIFCFVCFSSPVSVYPEKEKPIEGDVKCFTDL